MKKIKTTFLEGKSPTSNIRDIIMREADKGGKNFVIHKKACEPQLQNEPFYKKIDKDIYHKITIIYRWINN